MQLLPRLHKEFLFLTFLTEWQIQGSGGKQILAEPLLYKPYTADLIDFTTLK